MAITNQKYAGVLRKSIEKFGSQYTYNPKESIMAKSRVKSNGKKKVSGARTQSGSKPKWDQFNHPLRRVSDKDAAPVLRSRFKSIALESPIPSLTNIDDLVDQRGEVYGHPYENFNNIAEFWSTYIRGKYGHAEVKIQHLHLSREDIGFMMDLLKTARGMHTVTDEVLDDKDGYMQCIRLIQERRRGEVI